MVDNGKAKHLIPPYLPFKTVTNFCDNLKSAIPSQIDRSLMKSHSGTVQSQLMAALEYLGLVSPDLGIPSELLYSLVHAEGEKRQALMKEMLTYSYLFLFNNGLDLERATQEQLQERFRQAGVSGDTLRKAVAFFLKAAKEAGIKLSPHFKRSYTHRPTGLRGKRKANTTQASPASNIVSQEERGSNQSELLAWQRFLFEKFPKFDPEWSDEVKKDWFQAIRDLKPDFTKKSE